MSIRMADPIVVSESLPPLMPAPSRRLMAMALGLLALITVADLFVPRLMLANLYVLPLVIAARAGYGQSIWRLALALVGLTFAVYFVKFWIWPPTDGPQFFNFRLVNRALVAICLCVAAKVLEMWVESERDRNDPCLPDEFVWEEDEVNRTLATACFLALSLAIGLADFLTGVTINFSTLYLVPVLLCAWTRNWRVLWFEALGLTALSLLICFAEADETTPEMFRLALNNRLLVILVVAAVTLMLQFWIRADDALAARGHERSS